MAETLPTTQTTHLDIKPVNVSPSKLAHIIFLTDHLEQMRDWYMKVLNATIAHEDANLCFLRYDDEHHRVGFVKTQDMVPLPAGPTRSLHHYAFSYGSLAQLLGTYLRLNEQGIKPYWCINHGPSSSMYYKDPDGHRVELLVDNMTNDEIDAFFAAGNYKENPIGVEFEPEDWIRRLAAGEDVKTVTKRGALPPGVTPWEIIRD
jgi:catechol-2,3-dioxygenase